MPDILTLSPTLRFPDPDEEERFRALYYATEARQFTSALMLALVLLLGFGVFDYFVMNQGRTGPLLWTAWSARGGFCIGYAVIAVMMRRMRPERLPLLVSIAYLPTIVLVWWMTVAGPDGTPVYLHAFALISLAGLTLIPHLFAHALVVQPVFVLPFLHVAVTYRGSLAAAVGEVGFPFVILLSTILFGLHAKFHSERELRRNFVQSQRLADALEDATAADRAKSDFLAIVSHELRSPLNAILGNLELLRDRVDVGAEGLRAAASEAGRAMAALVDDILAFAARREATARDVVAVPFQPADIAGEVLATYGTGRNPSEGLRLDFARVDTGSVRGDPARLRHILLNLVGNAMKYGGDGPIHVRIRSREHHLTVIVADTGPGIPEGLRDTLFEPYAKGDPMSPGVGLGLAIVADIVRDAGGRITFRSRKGAGTVFRVSIPFPRDEAGQMPADGAVPEPSAPPLRLLVVDDEPLGRAVLANLLRREGHLVEEAGSVDEALCAIGPEAPDAVLTDLRMPGRDGYDLADALGTEGIPVIAVTANILGDAGTHAAFDALVPRPVDLVALRSALAATTQRVLAGPFAARDCIDALPSPERAEVLSSFQSNIQATIRTLAAADTPSELGETAHRLRGLLATLGHPKEALIAARLEDCASQGPGDTDAPRAALILALRRLQDTGTGTDRAIS